MLPLRWSTFFQAAWSLAEVWWRLTALSEPWNCGRGRTHWSARCSWEKSKLTSFPFLLRKHNNCPELFILRKVLLWVLTVGLGGERGEGLGFHLTHLLQADSTKTNTGDLISTNCIKFHDLTGKKSRVLFALCPRNTDGCLLNMTASFQMKAKEWSWDIFTLLNDFFSFILNQSKAPEWFPVYFSDCGYCSCPVIGWRLVALVEVYGGILTT